jgi:hypothetical protein
MIDRAACSAAATTAPTAGPPRCERYQEALRRLAVVTLIVALPGAGIAVRGWQGHARTRRSWPPGVPR